jgi:hypothetical protein
MKSTRSISFGTFTILWVVAVLLPFGIYAASPALGIIAGISLPIVWISSMPTTCMSGGFIATLMAFSQIGFCLAWAIPAYRMWIK